MKYAAFILALWCNSALAVYWTNYPSARTPVVTADTLIVGTTNANAGLGVTLTNYQMTVLDFENWVLLNATNESLLIGARATNNDALSVANAAYTNLLKQTWYGSQAYTGLTSKLEFYSYTNDFPISNTHPQILLHQLTTNGYTMIAFTNDFDSTPSHLYGFMPDVTASSWLAMYDTIYGDIQMWGTEPPYAGLVSIGGALTPGVQLTIDARYSQAGLAGYVAAWTNGIQFGSWGPYSDDIIFGRNLGAGGGAWFKFLGVQDSKYPGLASENQSWRIGNTTNQAAGSVNDLTLYNSAHLATSSTNPGVAVVNWHFETNVQSSRMEIMVPLTNTLTIGAGGGFIGSGAGLTAASVPATALANTGTPGTYRSVATTAQGLVSAGSNPTTFSGYAISDTSANLGAALTDGTGKTGLAVFSSGPTVTNQTTKGDSYGTNASNVSTDGWRMTNNLGGIYATGNVVYATGPASFSGQTNRSTSASQMEGTDASNGQISQTMSAWIDAQIGSTRGSVLERGAGGWSALAPGSSGTFLGGNGVGADPSYSVPVGGGSAIYTSGTNVTMSATTTNIDFWSTGSVGFYLTNRANHLDVYSYVLASLATLYPQAHTNNDNRTGGSVFNDPVVTTNAASGYLALPTGTNITFIYWGTNAAGVLLTNKMVFNPGSIGGAFNLEIQNTNAADTFTVTQDGKLVAGTNSQMILDTSGNLKITGGALVAAQTNSALTAFTAMASGTAKNSQSVAATTEGFPIVDGGGTKIPYGTNCVPFSVTATNLQVAIATNQVYQSNIISAVLTFASASNSLPVYEGGGDWLLVSATPTSITNVTGSTAGYIYQNDITVSNSTAAAFTNWITVPAAKARGYAATNALAVLGFNGAVVPASGEIFLHFETRGVNETNYWISY